MAVIVHMHHVFYLMLFNQEANDTHWLSQHLAITTLQKNLPAVLAALAEETEVNKCPMAKGLYGFCCTYRFVAAVYMQADVLPHLARLSKIFQKENVNFLAIKDQVDNNHKNFYNNNCCR